MRLTVDVGQLPVRWEIKEIGDICNLMTGGTPSRNKPEYFINGQIKWLVSGDIHSKEIYDCEGRITEEGLKNSNAKYLPVNSVLIALNGQGKTRGTVALLRTKATCNQSLVSICPKKEIELIPKYIFYNLHSRYPEIRKITGDDNKERRGLNMPIIRKIKIPVPPLPEQKRIVAILDEAFEGIDRAIANTKKNLTNSRELFQSILKAQFSSIKNDWITTTIGKQITLQRGFDITKKQQNLGKIPVVSSGGIKSFHNIAMAQAPGVVIGRKGTLGKVFYLDKDFWPHDTTLWVKDFNKNYPRFVYYFFQTLDVIKLDTGTANPALNRNLIHPIEVNWPPISQQEEITKKLDFLSIETQRLETIYRQKLVALNELKQSILQKAFTGELTANTANQVRKTAKEEIAA